jgi:hypothetical protein
MRRNGTGYNCVDCCLSALYVLLCSTLLLWIALSILAAVTTLFKHSSGAGARGRALLLGRVEVAMAAMKAAGAQYEASQP